MDAEKIEKALIDLGLQRYEAEVYRVLVELGEATVREIATNCTVPREKIYFILKNLEKAGIVRLVEKQPKRYVAMPPEEVFKSALAAQKKKYENAVVVVNYLQRLYEEGSRNIDKRELKFWELGRDTMDRLARLIEGCGRSLLIAAAPDHVKKFAEHPIYDRLKRLAKKEVEITVYTWLNRDNVRHVGRLTNVARVFVASGPAWGASLILSDEDKGMLLFSDYASIYFINRRMVEFYGGVVEGLRARAVEFEELDKLLSIEDADVSRLALDANGLHTLYDRWLGNLLDNRQGFSGELARELYDSLDRIIPISSMSIGSVLNLVSFFAYALGDGIKVSFSESDNTLVLEVPWSPEVEEMIKSGATTPPSPWIHILLEHLRRRGYKEQTTTIVHYKANGLIHFIKHFTKQ